MGFLLPHRNQSWQLPRRMQLIHNQLNLPRQDTRQQIYNLIDRILDLTKVIPRWSAEDIIHHIFGTSGMINTYTKTPEFPSSHGTHDIPQAIMASVPSTKLQASHTSNQIKLIMCNQNLFERDLVVFREARNCLAAAIHVG